MIYQRGVSFFEDARQWLGATRFDVIFDVGANVGQSAHVFSDECPLATIYCFEPVQRAYDDLLRNTKHLPNIKPFRLAMSRTAGEVDINVAEETSLSSIEVEVYGSEVQRVPVSTIDDFCEQNGIERIDFLKIDTEGHDIDVLVGASTMLLGGRVNFVQVEASFYSNNPRFIEVGRFVGFLKGLGYEVFWVYDQMPHPTGRSSVAYMNVVFVNRKLLKEPPWK